MPRVRSHRPHGGGRHVRWGDGGGAGGRGRGGGVASLARARRLATSGGLLRYQTIARVPPSAVLLSSVESVPVNFITDTMDRFACPRIKGYLFRCNLMHCRGCGRSGHA